MTSEPLTPEYILDDFDRKLLNRLQSGFPLAPRPYLTLAGELGGSEEDILRRVVSLKLSGHIRRIGAVFNARSLGYQSTLCAAKVPDEKLEFFTSFIAAAPGVTHNYLRPGPYNAWFTFTGHNQAALDEFLSDLKKKAAINDVITLPAEHLFKIKVNFNI